MKVETLFVTLFTFVVEHERNELTELSVCHLSLALCLASVSSFASQYLEAPALYLQFLCHLYFQVMKALI